jgi:hypothetical protein
MARPREVNNEKSKSVTTKTLFKAMEEDLHIVTDLSSKSELNLIQKGAYIRSITKLGEALTFFRLPVLYLAPAQALKDSVSEYTLVEAFIYHRNQLLHGYLLDHLLGNETRYNNANHFLVKNIEQFTIAMSAIKSQDSALMPENLIKILNERSASTLNILDHCFYAIKSIENFYSTIATEGLHLDSPTNINKFMKERFSENLMSKFIESSIIEITTHLNEYNYQRLKENIHKEPKTSPLRIHETEVKEIALNYLFTAAGRIRNQAVHESVTLGKKKISEALIHLTELKDKYLVPMQEALIKNGYQYSKEIEKFTKHNTITEASVDSKPEIEDEKNTETPIRSKRNSQDLTSESSNIPKKPKDERTAPEENPAGGLINERDANPWARFESRHPEVTSHQATTSSSTLAKQVTSNTADDKEDSPSQDPHTSSRRSP